MARMDVTGSGRESRRNLSSSQFVIFYGTARSSFFTVTSAHVRQPTLPIRRGSPLLFEVSF